MVSGLEELGITDDVPDDKSQDSPLFGAPKNNEAPGSGDEQSDKTLTEMLEQVPLFKGLLPVHLERMARLAKFSSYKKNEYVFKHGDESDGLYLVVEGAIRISRNVSGMGEEALAILREGQHFGEMSIIDDDVPRSADAICHERSRLLQLPKDDLRDLMFVDRELAYELLWRFVRTLSGRLRDSNDRLMMLTMSSKF